MPSSPLIPEKRMNVNGHMVTKHVKARYDDNASVSIPKPSSIDVQASRQRLLDEALNQVIEALAPFEGSFANDRYREQCSPVFSTFTDETLTDIANYGREDSQRDNLYMYAGLSLLAESEAEEKHFRHLMQMHRLMEDDFQIEETDDMIPLCLGLDFYDQYVLSQHEIVSRLTNDERTSYYWALLGVTVTLQAVVREQDMAIQHGLRKADPDAVSPINEIRVFPGAQYVSPVIEDPDLVDLVINNLDRVPDLIEFMMDRSETNTQALTDYVNNTPHRALAEGHL